MWNLVWKSTWITTDTVNVHIQNIKTAGKQSANITTSLFQEMVQAGTRRNKPSGICKPLWTSSVTDGDTGTNMEWPSKNGAKEVSDRSAFNCWRSSRDLAKRSLDGARGTQELSLQLFRDFLKVSKTKKNEDGAPAAAFQSGVEGL